VLAGKKFRKQNNPDNLFRILLSNRLFLKDKGDGGKEGEMV